MAELDIAEKRLPQDGRFTFNMKNGFQRDVRLSTCPTALGEKCVIRILNPHRRLLTINELGLTDIDAALFRPTIQQPQGLILVTGPTGSGKTMTLYTALNQLNSIHKNITTIEDPIEIQLDGITQVNVQRKAGLDFTTALRAFLRQDPDIIMVGEIRDHETASMAIRAAQTGHLVLATLHTNGAAEAITRLLNMGIAPYNIADTVILIIAQRLIRCLCHHCKTPVAITPDLLLHAGFKDDEINTFKLYQAAQCRFCTQGYHGRTGVFELLPITTRTRQLILANQIIVSTQHLWAAALAKVKAGITSLTEITRVVGKPH